MCKFSSKSGGVPFQPLGDLTWNDPITDSMFNFGKFLTKNAITFDQR